MIRDINKPFRFTPPQEVFILTRNGAVENASKDLKFSYALLQKLSTALGKPCVLSYVQVWRIMNERKTFVHQLSPNNSIEIITRELMYTRRKKRMQAERTAAEQQQQ